MPPTHATPGERGVMVAMGHGLCVSFWVRGEMTKNRSDLKKCNATWSLSALACKGYVISYYVVGFPLVFRWFYYLKIVGLILPINFNFW